MELTIQWAPILVSAVVLMGLGFGWYHEKVFGKAWMKLAKLKEKEIKENMAKPMVVSVLWSFLIPFALFHIIYVTDAFYADSSWLVNSVGVGVWVGAIFGFLTNIMHDLFEVKPVKLALINSGFYFVSILISSAIIGLMGA